MSNLSFNQPEYYFNRELSWLEFNERVLQEAKNRENPLLERIKFLSIVSSNLDEFFMIRVAGLKDQVAVGYTKTDAAGLTPKKQLERISDRVHKMVKDQCNCLNRSVFPTLKRNGINVLLYDELNKDQRRFVEQYFNSFIYPVLTPMAVDSSRPFPLILNKSLNIGVLVKQDSDHIFATVQVPAMLPRLIELQDEEENQNVSEENISTRNFIFLEEIIKRYIYRLFSGHKVICAFAYRITRNADLTIHEDEAEDLLMEIEKSLKKRKWGAAVRLEVSKGIDERLLGILKKALDLRSKDIYHIQGPLDLTFLMKMYSVKGYDKLKYKDFQPQIPVDILANDNLFELLESKDIIFHHPFDSFEPIIDFIKRAAQDGDVLAIKQTLYRVSGDSPIVEALAEAAERGKQVTVLVELKARFDEENNILWAKRLEKAGCHVIYGLVGLKTHCKITLVVRNEADGIKRYVHFGTGNYNDITARFYTDIGFITSNEKFGADASAVFNMLSGYSEPPKWHKLQSAPRGLREKLLSLIENETERVSLGEKGYIIAKMNSLVDPQIINALYKASKAGVEIELIVRGICCLKPGIEGVSDNITVRSVVGRFLEHSRIFYFYNGGKENVFISSADWMQRNLDRRVELLVPIEDEEMKKQLKMILEITLKDNVKARILNKEGKYKRIDKRGKNKLDSQQYFCELALKDAKSYNEEKNKIVFKPITYKERTL